MIYRKLVVLLGVLAARAGSERGGQGLSEDPYRRSGNILIETKDKMNILLERVEQINSRVDELENQLNILCKR